MFFFSPMCGEAMQSSSKRKAWEGGRCVLSNSCTVPLLHPPLSACPFGKPPEPAIRQISLCHPWNVEDNYRLSNDPRPFSFHRHSADPTIHTAFTEGKVEVGESRENQMRTEGLEVNHIWTNRLFYLITQNMGWSKAILPFQLFFPWSQK